MKCRCKSSRRGHADPSLTTKPSKTNLYTATRIWRRAAQLGPLIAWHAREAGLLAVAMGAEGYEVGMCTGERHNARSQQRTRTNAPDNGPRYQGAYDEAIGKTLERRVVETLSKMPDIHQGDLGCFNTSCCPRAPAASTASSATAAISTRSAPDRATWTR